MRIALAPTELTMANDQADYIFERPQSAWSSAGSRKVYAGRVHVPRNSRDATRTNYSVRTTSPELSADILRSAIEKYLEVSCEFKLYLLSK